MSEQTGNLESLVAANVRQVRERAARALERAGRAGEELTLVAVTKTVEPPLVDALARAGVRHVGENRVQDALAKAPSVRETFTWHMIGHLQRNKVRKALGLFRIVHSLDSRRLADTIDREAKRRGIVVPVFLQCNVSGEASKHGLDPGEAEPMAEHCRNLEGLRVEGLMTMAPYSEDPETARPVFRALAGLRRRLAGSGLLDPGAGLSMGMSGDFEVAVEEGATTVRVGSALFRGTER